MKQHGTDFGVVDSAKIEPALHLLEPARLAVQTPGGVVLGADLLPDLPLEVVGDGHSCRPLQNEAEQQRMVIVVVELARVIRVDTQMIQSEFTEVGHVIRLGIVAEPRQALGVVYFGTHQEQLLQRDIRERRAGKLRKIAREWILHTVDEAVLDRHADQERVDRLDRGKRRLHRIRAMSVVIRLIDDAVAVDDNA